MIRLSMIPTVPLKAKGTLFCIENYSLENEFFLYKQLRKIYLTIGLGSEKVSVSMT